MITSAFPRYESSSIKSNNMQTQTKKKVSKLLQIAMYLKANRQASIYELQRKFFKNNPADTIMSLRNLYGWIINSVKLDNNRYVYKVRKVGKMPLA